MTIYEATRQLISRLALIYDHREATAIADLVMENISGLKKVDRIIHKNTDLSLSASELLSKYSEDLLSHKPVQYVLHEAWFCGMKFYVDEQVLIPRPETEELVEWVIAEIQSSKKKTETKLRILDIGTGSGCIAVALKKKLPEAEIHTCDISREALEVAKRNAFSHKTDIQFFQLDFLDENSWSTLDSYQWIVSNPPYIPLYDKKNMQPNIVDYEPHLALFVTENNPLVFYEAIAAFAVKKLLPPGEVFLELHEELASRIKELFLGKNFKTAEIRKDIHGRDRMLKATMLL
ncbi:MAG TPA: peptide chain release factor N(5)-glutamine methyltransferase [Puia sp.]|nr:peptide chain release factor N(5)-glutamine methyltransferase [Puia sp.]